MLVGCCLNNQPNIAQRTRCVLLSHWSKPEPSAVDDKPVRLTQLSGPRTLVSIFDKDGPARG